MCNNYFFFKVMVQKWKIYNTRSPATKNSFHVSSKLKKWNWTITKSNEDRPAISTPASDYLISSKKKSVPCTNGECQIEMSSNKFVDGLYIAPNGSWQITKSVFASKEASNVTGVEEIVNYYYEKDQMKHSSKQPGAKSNNKNERSSDSIQKSEECSFGRTVGYQGLQSPLKSNSDNDIFKDSRRFHKVTRFKFSYSTLHEGSFKDPNPSVNDEVEEDNLSSISCFNQDKALESGKQLYEHSVKKNKENDYKKQKREKRVHKNLKEEKIIHDSVVKKPKFYLNSDKPNAKIGSCNDKSISENYNNLFSKVINNSIPGNNSTSLVVSHTHSDELIIPKHDECCNKLNRTISEPQLLTNTDEKANKIFDQESKEYSSINRNRQLNKENKINDIIQNEKVDSEFLSRESRLTWLDSEKPDKKDKIQSDDQNKKIASGLSTEKSCMSDLLTSHKVVNPKSSRGMTSPNNKERKNNSVIEATEDCDSSISYSLQCCADDLDDFLEQHVIENVNYSHSILSSGSCDKEYSKNNSKETCLADSFTTQHNTGKSDEEVDNFKEKPFASSLLETSSFSSKKERKDNSGTSTENYVDSLSQSTDKCNGQSHLSTKRSECFQTSNSSQDIQLQDSVDDKKTNCCKSITISLLKRGKDVSWKQVGTGRERKITKLQEDFVANMPESCVVFDLINTERQSLEGGSRNQVSEKININQEELKEKNPKRLGSTPTMLSIEEINDKITSTEDNEILKYPSVESRCHGNTEKNTKTQKENKRSPEKKLTKNENKMSSDLKHENDNIKKAKLTLKTKPLTKSNAEVDEESLFVSTQESFTNFNNTEDQSLTEMHCTGVPHDKVNFSEEFDHCLEKSMICHDYSLKKCTPNDSKELLEQKEDGGCLKQSTQEPDDFKMSNKDSEICKEKEEISTNLQPNSSKTHFDKVKIQKWSKAKFILCTSTPKVTKVNKRDLSLNSVFKETSSDCSEDGIDVTTKCKTKTNEEKIKNKLKPTGKVSDNDDSAYERDQVHSINTSCDTDLGIGNDLQHVHTPFEKECPLKSTKITRSSLNPTKSKKSRTRLKPKSKSVASLDQNSESGTDSSNSSLNTSRYRSYYKSLRKNIKNITAEEVIDEIQCALIASEEELENLKKLNIKITWELPKLHEVDNGSQKTSIKKLKMKVSPEVEVSTEIFSISEEKRIRENWNDFAKKYGFDNPELFVSSNQLFGVFRYEERLKFKQFLAQGLPNRRLYSVYHKFMDIYSVHTRGRWTQREDTLLLDLYHTYKEQDGEAQYAMPRQILLQRALGRTWMSVHRRLQILLRDQQTSSNSQMKIKWTQETKGKMIYYLVKYMKCKSLKKLRDADISSAVWKKVSAKLDLPEEKLSEHWRFYLYPQLFARTPFLHHQLYRELISWLHRSGVSQWKKVDWADLSIRAGHLGSCFLQKCFRTLVLSYVPKRLHRRFRACVVHLYETYLPTLQDKPKLKMLQRVKYDPVTRLVQDIPEEETKCASFTISTD